MAEESGRNLRHDLRTPVNHLVGYSDLLLEEAGLAPELSEALTAVRELAQGSLAAIASIVDDAEAVDGEALVVLDQAVAGISEAVAGARALTTPTTAPDIERLAASSGRLTELVHGLGSPASTAVAPEFEAATTAGSGSATVLVVDDDDANRDVLGRRLARLGYRVVEAANGAEALEVLARNDAVDLVLLDLMMPVMDGFGVLERRRGDQRLGAIPVVMISALDQVEHVARCIELGADDYLTKPFDPVLLKARAGACIEKKQMHDREAALLKQVTDQAEQLREWNAELERRVAEQVREVERLSLMERFVAPQLAEVIANGGAELLASHRREIAVLFCDLRGFTAFAETSEPEEVMSVLRELHETIGPRIFEHGGTLAQFTGDGMMVFFNDPLPCDEPEWRAASLALDMAAAAATLSEGWRQRGHHLELGAGLAMGYATCGLVGFEGRFEYTAIGTVTNLAARLCQEAKGGQVLASERIRAAIGERAVAAAVGELTLKGFARPVPAFELTRTANVG